MTTFNIWTSTADSKSLERVNMVVDGMFCMHKVDGNTITFDTELGNGFHLLELHNLTNSTIQLIDVEVDGVSLLHTLYMTFALDRVDKRQTTILNNNDKALYVPFINPISQWISTCAEKVPYSLMAGDLYNKYDVYFPESIEIPDTYPKLVRDFFMYNSDFHIHPKKKDAFACTDVPYSVASGIKYVEEELLTEFMFNLSYMQEVARLPKQSEYNNSKLPWKVVDLMINESRSADLDSLLTVNREKLPHLYQFLTQFKTENIAHAFIGILAPGEYISPHCDTYEEYKHVNGLVGCTQIYIPINFKKGNFFKMNKVGLVPVGSPTLINTYNFSHSLINDSDEYRFALAVVGVNPGAQ